MGDYGRIRERPYRRRGGYDRERRLQTTILVGGLALLLIGLGVGFGIGRATAPGSATPSEATSTAVVEETTLPAGVVEEVPSQTVDVSAEEASASAETTTSDTESPPRPKQLAPANGAVISASRVTLRWSKVTDDQSAVTYSFAIQTRMANGTYGATQVIRGLKTTSYSARVLSARRRWRVWAVDGAGNQSSKSPWRTFIHSYVAPKKSTPATSGSDETT